MFNYADLFYIGQKEILQVITKTPEPYIQPDHMPLNWFTRTGSRINGVEIVCLGTIFRKKTKCREKYCVLATYTIR